MYMNLIVGRTGSGKSQFARLLENEGMKKVISTTTRKPRKNEPENEYHFIDHYCQKKNALNKPIDELAHTVINHEHYFIARKDLKNSDFYIIDFNGAIDLAKQTPDITYHLIHIINMDDEARLNNLKSRYAENYPKQDNETDSNYHERIFGLIKSRNDSENDQFTKLEKLYHSGKLLESLPDNIDGYFPIENDLKDINSLKTQAYKIKRDYDTRRRLCNMIKKSVDYGITTYGYKGFEIKATNPETNKIETKFLHLEQFADLVYDQPVNFQRFMGSMLAADSNLDKIYPDD